MTLTEQPKPLKLLIMSHAHRHIAQGADYRKLTAS